MGKLEHEIKERLAQSTSMEGVDTEGLWNAISEAAYPTEAPRKKKRLGFIWFLIAAGTIGAMWSVLSEKELKTSEYIPRQEGATEEIEFRRIISTVTEESKGESTNKAKKIFATQTTVESVTTNELENNQTQRLQQNTASDDENGTTGRLTNSIENDQEDVSSQEDESDVPARNVAGLNEDESNSLSAKPIALHDLKFMQLREHSILWYVPPFVLRERETQTFATTKKLITWKIYGGGLIVQNSFTSEATGFADSLNTNLSTDLGFTFGGLIQLKQSKNWNVSVGLEYSQWNDRFDKVLLSDTLVELNQELVPARNIRTVEHYNTASVIAIPFQLELFKDIERFRLGVGLGASYSFVLSQKGRLLKDEITVAYYTQNEKRYANFLSARIAPSVGYKLNRKVLLNGSCTIGFQGHGTNNINQLKSRSVAIMPTIGLTFNY